MIRWSVLAAGTVAAMIAAFVTGAATPSKEKPPLEVKADIAKPPVVVGQRTGYFNMAKVMREYKRAKTAVERLNARRNRMAANLMAMRAMYTQLQDMAKNTTDNKRKDEIANDLIQLARQMEDLDRAINKILNDKASFIIVELYDEMYAVVAGMAREQGLVAILAYPDATSREELENPHIKELKLKPPAAQPFYIDSSVDFSDEIIRRLNDKFKAENDD